MSEPIDLGSLGLPGWLAFSPVVVQGLAAAGLAWTGGRLLGWMLLWGPRRLPPGTHWTERARSGWPAQVAARNWIVLSVVLAPGCAVLINGGDGLQIRALACILGALAAASLSLAHVQRVLREVPAPAWPDRLRGMATTWIIFFPFLPIVLGGVALVPAQVGAWAAAVILATMLAIFAATRGAGVQLARRIGLATAPDERVTRVVAGAAARTGVTPRCVSVAPHATANALAFPPGGHLVLTRRLLEVLSDEELSAVCMHELGHLGEPRRLILLRQSLVVVLAALVGLIPAFSLGPFPPLALVSLFLVWTLFVRRLARRLEERADAVARAHEPEPGAYAAALARLYRMNVIPAVLPGRHTIHPHLYDRMVAAGVTPDYPRPRPPVRRFPLLAVIGTAVALATLMAMLAQALERCAVSSNPWLATVALTATGLNTPALIRLAQCADATDDEELAVARWFAATRLDPHRTDVAAYAVMRLALIGRCDEAEALFATLPPGTERAQAREWIDFCHSPA